MLSREGLASQSQPPLLVSHFPAPFTVTATTDDIIRTDLFKPGLDDRDPVLNGGNGVRVADGQESVPHTGGFT